jgi:OPA family glycerol-3-phosphate transporter-like MFS transporter
LIFFIGGILVTVLPWQWVFFVPSMVVAVMSFLTYKVVRNHPEDCGFPELDVQDASSGDVGSGFKYVLKKVFTNPVTIAIAVAEFCTGFVRHGFEQWFPRYMQEAKHLPLESTIFQKGAAGVVIAGILGAVFAGTISDWVFKGRRPPVAFLGYAVQIICLMLIWWADNINLVIVAFTFNSFAISVVHSMLSGTASMDFGGKKAAATATGMFDGMQYMGGSFVGIGMGALLDTYGWDAWGPSMIGFAVIGAGIMLALWNARPKSSAKTAH